MAIDPDYVLFLSMKDLNTKTKLKYKAFFDRIPDIVKQAHEIIINTDISVLRQPQTVVYPGGWRGW